MNLLRLRRLKFLYCIIALLCLSATAQATSITVASTTINDLRFTGTTFTMRIWATGGSFFTSDGRRVLGGSVGSANVYKTVSCTRNTSTFIGTCPSFVIGSTTDASVNKVSFYTAVIYDVGLTPRGTFLENFKVPISYGLTVTWAQLALYNSTSPRPPNLGHPTTDQVASMIALAVASGNPMTTVLLGRGYVDVAPADAALPTLVGTNSPRVPPATGDRVCYAAQMSGADVGAKVNACDTALGADKGAIVLSGGGNIATTIVVSSYHELRVLSGTYTATTNGPVIRLKDFSALVCASWTPIIQESSGSLAAASPMMVVATWKGSGSEPGASNGNLSQGVSIRGCHLQGQPEIPATVSITAGSNNVTATTSVFTGNQSSVSNRYQIRIAGAGVAGATLTALLVTTPTGTTATLDTLASTTVSGASAIIEFFNSAYSAISLGACHNCEVRDNWLDATHSIGIAAGGGSMLGNYAQDVLIEGNLLTEVASQNIAATNGKRILIKNNVMLRPGQVGGPGVAVVDIEPNIGDIVRDFAILSNYIDTTESPLIAAGQVVQHAIVVQNGNGASPFEGVVINDNQVIGTRHSTAGSHNISGAGILIRDNASATVTNNFVQRVSTCITIDNGAGGSVVEGNKCASTGSGSTFVINVADSNDNRIVGNYLYDRFGDALGLTTNAYRIVESGTANFNTFSDNHGATYQISGASTTINADPARPTAPCATGIVCDTYGTNSPEGVVAAGVGSTFRQTNGAAGTVIYFKESGTGTTGWRALPTMLTGTATLDFASIAANAQGELTVTVTGAALGDVCFASPSTTLESGLAQVCYISATNTATVRLTQNTAGAIDPASRSWKVAVLK